MLLEIDGLDLRARVAPANPRRLAAQERLERWVVPIPGPERPGESEQRRLVGLRVVGRAAHESRAAAGRPRGSARGRGGARHARRRPRGALPRACQWQDRTPGRLRRAWRPARGTRASRSSTSRRARARRSVSGTRSPRPPRRAPRASWSAARRRATRPGRASRRWYSSSSPASASGVPAPHSTWLSRTRARSSSASCCSSERSLPASGSGQGRAGGRTSRSQSRSASVARQSSSL